GDVVANADGGLRVDADGTGSGVQREVVAADRVAGAVGGGEDERVEDAGGENEVVGSGCPERGDAALPVRAGAPVGVGSLAGPGEGSGGEAGFQLFKPQRREWTQDRWVALPPAVPSRGAGLLCHESARSLPEDEGRAPSSAARRARYTRITGHRIRTSESPA